MSAVPGYYVSCVDGSRVALPAGPFATHEEALAAVDAQRSKWVELDPRAHFAAWGTCRVRADSESAPEESKRRVRLPLFEPQPSAYRFRVYVNSIGGLCWRPAGAPPPDNGRWEELARVNMPRHMPQQDWDAPPAAYDALLRVYAL
jgi:hypothetical protein